MRHNGEFLKTGRVVEATRSPGMERVINEQALEQTALDRLSDTLLPKLISGKLRVPDAERVLEAVG